MHGDKVDDMLLYHWFITCSTSFEYILYWSDSGIKILTDLETKECSLNS